MADQSDGSTPGLLLKDRPATLAGRKWIFRYAMIASLALKERWAIEEDAPLIQRISKERMTDIPALIWACMQTHHGEVTYEEALRMCDDAPADELLAAKKVAQECIVVGFTTKAKKKSGDNPATGQTRGS